MLPFPSPEITPPIAYRPLTEFLAVSNMTNCPSNKLLGGRPMVTVTVCVSLCVGSVADVAVILTVLPVGAALGAVKVVAAPLAVCAGTIVPQAPGLPQFTVQSTPAFAGSLLTVATKGALSA